MRTDDFEFAETVAALSCVIGLSIATGSKEHREAFVARLRSLISESERDSIRWRLYRHVLRDVIGEIEEPPEF